MTLCQIHPTQDQFVAEGVIAEKTKAHLVVAMDRAVVPADLGKHKWRLDMGVNKVSYDRMRAAIETFTSNKPHPLLMHNGTDLRDLIVGKVRPEQLDHWAAQPPAFLLTATSSTVTSAKPPPAPAVTKAPVSKPAAAASANNKSPVATPSLPALRVAPEQFAQALAQIEKGVLNDTQKHVIKDAMGRRLALVQGPPGTGKTHTAVFILRLWAQLFPDQCMMVRRDSEIHKSIK